MRTKNKYLMLLG